MINLHWYTILIIAIAALGSGLIGALIYAIVDTFQNQKPAIGKKIEVFSSHKDLLQSLESKSLILMNTGDRELAYHNLRVVRIWLENQSHRDFEKLPLSIAFPPNNAAIYLEPESIDRYHQVIQVTPLDLTAPQAEVELIFSPMNRGDRYLISLLVSTSTSETSPAEIELYSAAAIRFVDLENPKAIAKEIVKSTSISLGPIQLDLDKSDKVKQKLS